jgi:hypothetical protein
MKKEDIEFLKEAFNYLENPSLVTRVTDYLGKPLQKGMEKLPQSVQDRIGMASEKALRKSLEFAHTTLHTPEEKEICLESLKIESYHSRLAHNLATATTGAMGGFFGELGFLVELPISTTLIMRSILAQGQSYGNFSKEELITNSLYIFSLGSSKSKADDEMDTAYYTSRFAMDQAIKKAAEYLAVHGHRATLRNAEAGTAPILFELISKVAKRFNITISEKMLAKSVPVIGAVGGASINFAFTNFFTLSAKYHFGIIYLEKKYGKEIVEKQYSLLAQESKAA